MHRFNEMFIHIPSHVCYPHLPSALTNINIAQKETWPYPQPHTCLILLNLHNATISPLYFSQLQSQQNDSMWHENWGIYDHSKYPFTYFRHKWWQTSKLASIGWIGRRSKVSPRFAKCDCDVNVLDVMIIFQVI